MGGYGRRTFPMVPTLQVHHLISPFTREQTEQNQANANTIAQKVQPKNGWKAVTRWNFRAAQIQWLQSGVTTYLFSGKKINYSKLLNPRGSWTYHLFQHYSLSTSPTQYTYTECPRRNVPDFGRVFLMLNYTDITQNTYIQSWTFTEIMAREVWNFDSCYTLIDYQIHIKTGRNMLFL